MQKSNPSKIDIAIIGGGPAGISAAIYASYDGNSCTIFEEHTLAWIPEKHINILPGIEGFPGLTNKIKGTELVSMYRESLAFMNVVPQEHEKVLTIERLGPDYCIKTTNKKYSAKSVILCTGTIPKKLNLLDEGKYANKSLHYFCYGQEEKYRGKRVLVVGGRNSGATTAKYLAKNEAMVTIIEIKDRLQAKEKHTSKFVSLGIQVITSASVTKLVGKNGILTGVELLSNGKNLNRDYHAVFVCIGVDPNNKLALSLGVEVDHYGYVLVDNKQQTNIPGVFAAGDLCGNLKHVVAASGQGGTAAYIANQYIQKL